MPTDIWFHGYYMYQDVTLCCILV